jgi:hypothetical protein
METHDDSRSIPRIMAELRGSPPSWALWQRHLFTTLDRAAVEYVRRYTRSDGTLRWRDRWIGMDGSDDPYEGFHQLALFYVLGGSDQIHELSRTIWDAITWQWTEYGQIHHEFDAYYDWMHHGEGYLYTYYFGLADPTRLKDRQRALRFAHFYTGDDPDVPNYDPVRRLIRSPLTGSRGPRHQVTTEDFATHREVLDHYPPPFEDLPGVSGPTCPWTDDRIYAAILERFNARMARGDVPLNLTATSMVTHAFLYSGADRYRHWVLEYLDAWRERTARNGGITPDNVGLSGAIGEYNGDKWWGGYYGWRWPHGAFTILEPLMIAGCNALLLDGAAAHLDLARSQLDHLWRLGRDDHGQWLVPHRHTDSGWTDYRPAEPLYPIYLWTLSQRDEDLERVARLHRQDQWRSATPTVTKGFTGNAGPWFRYIHGHNPVYPEQILRANDELIRAQLERMRTDVGDPASWDIHHWQEMTPLVLEGLVQLLFGVPAQIYHGGLLHAQVRYFDGQRHRPGLPPAVAALVEGLDAPGVTLALVNLAPDEAREVVVQAGAFGEHRLREVRPLDAAGADGAPYPVGGRWVAVHLPPSTSIRVRLVMERYAHAPSYDTPWTISADSPPLIAGRQRAVP